MKQALLRCGCLVTWHDRGATSVLPTTVTVVATSCEQHAKLWTSGDLALFELRWPPSSRWLDELMRAPKVKVPA